MFQQTSTNNLQAQYNALLAEHNRLKAHIPKPRSLSLKIGEKGGLSVCGMGKFPTTLYKEQWRRLIAYCPEITAFLDANDSNLKGRGE